MAKVFWKANERLTPILKICLAPDSEVEKFLREWEARFTVDIVDGGLIRYIPYLYRRLLDLKIEPRDNYILRGAYFKSWWSQTVFQKGNVEYLSNLDSRFPDFSLLKGVALQNSVYSADPRTRPCDDVDILVNPIERKQAVAYLLNDGFKLDSVYSLNYVLRFRKSAPFVQDDISIDLNWGLYEYSKNPNYYEGLSFQSINIGKKEFKILSDTDNLIHIIVHGSGWNPVPSTRWILDATLLIKNGQIDWKEFVEKVNSNGWQYPLIDQITYLEQFKIYIPTEAKRSIESSDFDKFGRAMFFYQKQSNIWNRRLLRIAYADYLAFITNAKLRNTFVNFLRFETESIFNILRELRKVYTSRKR